MRGAGILAAVVVALVVDLAALEVLAKAQTPVVVTSMSTRPDAMQLQAATWEWLRTSVTSSTFIIGVIVGVAGAEIGRFAWRWLMRALGFATSVASTIVRYRLAFAAAIFASYYVVAYHVLG